MFNKLKAAFLAVVAAIGLMVAPQAVLAQATLPAGVETAITDAGDVLVLGATAVIVAMVAFWGLKKLGGKLGWW